jgi:signal peptidase II
MRFLAAIALPLYALDQATKWWIYTHFALDLSTDKIELFPKAVADTAHLPLEYDVIPGWFKIVHHGNTGAAFSMGSDYPWIFVVLSVVAFVALLFAWKKNFFTDKPSRLAVPLILSGIMGNVTDRLFHGYVVDFLSVDLHVRFANPWPTFNVADSCIFIAAGLFIYAAFLDAKRKKGATANVN